MNTPDQKTSVLHVGIDAGSTTIKAVVLNDQKQILWKDYQRHLGNQQQVAQSMLERIIAEHGEQFLNIYCTGSGGSYLAKKIDACFFQEVSAVSEAVTCRYPEVGSVIELGGQDAKMIIYPQGDSSKQKFFSMNDKCAGGTGSVIDKIANKLNLSSEQLSQLPYKGVTIHPVAAKCGVFAETDINGLQKSGVKDTQLFASLLDAIVLQNLTILARGNTLKPQVILLGGPNYFLPGLLEAWRMHIPRIWRERRVILPGACLAEDLIFVPEDALYFAALGAVDLGIAQNQKAKDAGLIPSVFIEEQDNQPNSRGSTIGLFEDKAEENEFYARYNVNNFSPPAVTKNTVLNGFVGLDCGSTSTKAALLDENAEVIELSYRISSGNPIKDTQIALAELEQKVNSRGIRLNVQSLVTTGYAKDMLKDIVGADIAIVETIAHANAATHFYPDTEVICDIGGQDIKLIYLSDGQIKDFRLNTQCSAGNGYFLQNAAEMFGIKMKDYASKAFSAKRYPDFSYGCSVFMQSDIVDFQRQGWEVEEILAGLAAVLPKNIWLYVASIPNLSSIGTKFLLQGGTQRNLAAVKAQVAYIQQQFADSEHTPSINVHKFCGESGAIGAALEGIRRNAGDYVSRFIGFAALEEISYTVTNDERTICGLCSKNCRRSFIDVPSVLAKEAAPASDLVVIPKDHIRIITGNHCEKGLVEAKTEIKKAKLAFKENEKKYPNLADYAARKVWTFSNTPPTQKANRLFFPKNITNRKNFVVGIPRVLNMYSMMPFFRGYFEHLGITQFVFSTFTEEEMYKEGSSRLSIDPCFPSKVALSHVQNLFSAERKTLPDFVFFPMLLRLPTKFKQTVNSYACPTITMTPDAVKAALTKEQDAISFTNCSYISPVLDMANPALLDKQLYDAFKSLLHQSKSENRQAVIAGFNNLQAYQEKLQQQALSIIDSVTRNNQIALVLLGRSYHNDPGINHGILEQLQQLGYPILTQDSLPFDHPSTDALFSQDISDQIDDVWTNSYSENTNQKIWAAKYVARHPNLVPIELSNFNCGHDAPIYSLITRIMEASKTPYFCFKDLDENKPAGSIKIRLETIDYFLKYRVNGEDLIDADVC